MACCAGGATVARTLVLSALLLALACSAANGPTGPFEPSFKHEYRFCKPDVHNPYCPPKHGEYPEPIRPPGWLKPYLAEPSNYTGLHNDLQKLLEVRHREKWVTLFQYTLGQRDFFLNALYTYLKFGDADFYIVATVTNGAFEDCVAMQLPCYNATPHYVAIAERAKSVAGVSYGPQLEHHKEDHHAHHDFGSILHMQLTWMNIHIGLAILELGYNFQHSDVDVGFMARVLPSMRLLERMGADVAMLALNFNATLNPANMFALANPRTIQLFHAYLHMMNNSKMNNEIAINRPQMNTSYTRCQTEQACSNVTASGVAAVLALPTLFNATSCHNQRMLDGACSSRRLFMHSLCHTGRPWKAWSLRASGLWFLTDFSGNEVNASAGLGPTLPCAAPDDVAWHRPLGEYQYYNLGGT